MKQTMKKIWSCAILLAAVLLTGCNNEETLFNGEQPQAQTGKLSFVIPMGGSKSVTYAATPDSILKGMEDEYKIEELWIYWFKDEPGGKLWDVFSLDLSTGSEITLSNASPGVPGTGLTASTTVATINVSEETFASRFYIVANVNGKSLVKSKGILLNSGSNGGEMFINGSTWEQFEAKLSDVLTAAAEFDPAEHLATPLPMTINRTTSTNPGGSAGYVSVASPSTNGAVDNVHLKRLVARFDIINASDYTGFTISKVYVSKAQTKGYLRDVPFIGNEGWPTAKLTIDGTGFNGKTGDPTDNEDWSGGSAATGQDKIPDDMQGSSPARDSLERHMAAFYLMPTLIKADNSLTEIMIEGTFGGVTKLYSLDLSALVTPQNDTVKIEANKLYTIAIRRATSETIDLKLYVDQWDDAAFQTEIPATGSGSDVTSWGTAQLAGGSVVDLNPTVPKLAPDTITYSSATPITLTIVNEGTAMKKFNGKDVVSTISFERIGTAGEDYLDTDYDLVSDMSNISSSTITSYGALYTTTHTVTLPPTDAPVEVQLNLTSAGNKANKKVIVVKSVNFNKLGKAVVGTTLNASTWATGKGRWEKAVVRTADATTGYPTQVAAIVATLPSPTDISAFPPNKTLPEIVSWLATDNASFATAELKASLTQDAGKYVLMVRQDAINLRNAYSSDILPASGNGNTFRNMLVLYSTGSYYTWFAANDDFNIQGAANAANLTNLNNGIQNSTVGIKVCGTVNY